MKQRILKKFIAVSTALFISVMPVSECSFDVASVMESFSVNAAETDNDNDNDNELIKIDGTNYESFGLSSDYIGYYSISNYSDLEKFASMLYRSENFRDFNINAVLINDIVLNDNLLQTLSLDEDNNIQADETTLSGLNKWLTIGYGKDGGRNVYSGIFDGNNKKISGLYANYKWPETEEGNFGFIGVLGSKGIIRDLCIEDSYIRGHMQIGGICGNSNGKIINCSYSGAVIGVEYAGGICGYNGGNITECTGNANITCGDDLGGICGINQGAVANCINSGSVKGSWHNGGITGFNNGGKISNSKNEGKIEGYMRTGGICGYNVGQCGSGVIEFCCNEGIITGNENVGGVCGYNTDGIIKQCYNVSTVTGNITVGGFCGVNLYSSCYKGTSLDFVPQIYNSYNIGKINGNDTLNGFCGINDNGIINNCYYDVSCVNNEIQDEYAVSSSSEQFKNGEVAYLLNCNQSDNVIWFQRIGVNDYPVLENKENAVVYYNEINDKVIYSNEEIYELEKINLPSDNLMIGVGGKACLELLLTPVNGYYEEVIWQSSDKSVVSVDNEGNVIALSSGEAKITVSVDDLSDTLDITVFDFNSSVSDPDNNGNITETVGSIIDNIVSDDAPILDNTDIPEEKIEEIKQEIQEAIQNGDTFHTDIKAIQETFDAYKDNWGQVKQAAKDLNAQFAGAYNIEVELCHKDKNDESHHICNITEFEKEVTFTFDLPTGATDKNKRYVLVRIHTNSDGTTEYTPLDVTINGDGTFTAKSNKFSSFILLEVEFNDESTPTEKHNYNNYGYCKYCGSIQNGTDAFVSANAVVGGKIGMNFKVALSAEAAADPEARMIFTMESGKEISIPLSQAALIDSEKNIYQFTLSLTSTQMDEKVTAKMRYSDAVTYPEGKTASVLEDYSVNKYLNNIQTAEETKENPNTRLIELIKAMRNYGAYMDIYSGDTSSDFVPEDLSNRQVSVDNIYSATIDGEVDGVTAKSASVTVGSLIDITVKFEALSCVDNLVFAVDGVQTQPVLKDGKYCITIPEISPVNYNKMYTITVTDGQSTMSVKYSALSYVKNKLNDSDQKLVNVCKAMYLYNEAVTQYKDN